MDWQNSWKTQKKCSSNKLKKYFIILIAFCSFNANAQKAIFSSHNSEVTRSVQSQFAALVSNGLVFYLDAANTSSYPGSGNTWNDLSGTNHMKFYSSSTYSTNANPTFDSDGGGSLVTTGIFGKSINNSSISGATARTFEGWVKFNAVLGNAPLSIGGMSTSALFEMMAYQNNLINHIWGTYTKSSTVLSINTWYHVVITYDGTTNHYVYLNGALVGTSSSADANNKTLNTTISPIYIGPAVTTTWGAFDGKIGALRIYNRALSLAEISTNFNVYKTRFGQ